MLLHPTTVLGTVSPRSGGGTVEEAGYGSIVGDCVCHPRQILRLLMQNDSNMMTKKTKTRRRCTLPNHSTQSACNFAQKSFPHSRITPCKPGEPRGKHHSMGLTMFQRQYVLLARVGQVELSVDRVRGLQSDCRTSRVDLIVRPQASQLNRVLVSFLKRHRSWRRLM